MVLIKKEASTSWTQDVNLMYIRRLEDIFKSLVPKGNIPWSLAVEIPYIRPGKKFQLTGLFK